MKPCTTSAVVIGLEWWIERPTYTNLSRLLAQERQGADDRRGTEDSTNPSHSHAPLLRTSSKGAGCVVDESFKAEVADASEA